MSAPAKPLGLREWLLGLRGAAAWLWLSALVIVLDQVTKYYVVMNFDFAQRLVVNAWLDITRLHNTGAAFSFLASQPGWQRWLFISLGLGVSVFIMVWLRRLPPRGSGWLAAALALVLGGALGNIIDRVVHHHVIDFIHLHYGDWYWPAFNVADAAISVGAVILVLESFVSHWRTTRRARSG